jgi:predicted nuclease of predicted toxin-antitoxin system
VRLCWPGNELLVDMNLSPRWVRFLAEAGIDAVHWVAVGPSNAPDTVIMAYARTNDFVVLTHDLDFGAILAATQGEKPSVIQIRADNLSPEIIGAQIVATLGQLKAELDQGVLVTVDPNRTRLRVLPLVT